MPKDIASGFINNQKERYQFGFNHVFDQKTTQQQVFDTLGRPIALSVLDGFNGTIFAYGQTGSGKTFTITGGQYSYEDRGIIPRTLAFIFEESARRVDRVYSVRVSYLEIYNNDGYDLLRNEDQQKKKLEDLPKVQLITDANDEIHLKNIGTLPVAGVDEALNCLFIGETNRMMCETPSNDQSSRSHCIFTIYIEAREVAGNRIRRSKV